MEHLDHGASLDGREPEISCWKLAIVHGHLRPDSMAGSWATKAGMVSNISSQTCQRIWFLVAFVGLFQISCLFTLTMLAARGPSE